jgi:hypothetical protein
MSVTAANSTPATNSLGVTPEAPWLGLRSFTEEVRDYFYGRDKEIQELFERVQHRTLTVLYGQSGWGKTSLLRAGLIPRLRDAGQTPLLIRLDFLDNPSADFNEASLPANVDLGSWARMMGECGIVDFIRECLEAQVVRKVRTTLRIERIGYDQAQQPSLWELFHDPGWGLTDTDLTPVLMFDQFEELFTQGEARRPDDAKAFFEALACLVENRPPASVRERMERDDDFADRLQTGPTAVKVLLTLRDDFLHRLERGRRRMPSMMDNRFELRPLRGPEAIRAVYDPGAIRGITSPIIPLETAAAIVRLVAGVPAQTPLDEIDNVPPLLSLMCEQLNVRRLARSESQIQIEGLANAPEVLREFYEASFATHPEALREFIEDDLVSESGFRESRTVQAAVEHLAARGVPDGAARLRQLVDSRLLVIEERGGVERMELTHDILAPIIVAARRERSDRLAREVARQQLAEERKKRRRFAAVTATMTLLLIAAIASGGLAWLAAQTARIEQARSRAAENQRRVAEQARVDEVITRQRYQALLHRVSVIDVAAGNRIMEEVYAAERTGPSPRGFSGVPKSREAGALWARALEHEPENQLAADRLWSLLRTRSSTRSMALRQRGDVFHASVSLDGRRIVTASEDKTARIWDAETVQPDGEPPRHNGAVRHASFSPDGRYVVTACWDNTARIWDAETGLAHGEPLRHDDTVWLTSFSPDGRRVVTTSSDNTARIWDADTGQPHGEPLQHDHVVIHASFSPDGRRIVTASWDKTARIWDAETGQLHGEPFRHDGFVYRASFSPNGRRIVTASEDKTARIWDAETGQPHGEPLRHDNFVRHASFSPDGRRIVTASDDKTARIWDAETGQPYGEPLRHDGAVRHASFSPDGRRIVTASDDKTARIWDAQTGQPRGGPLLHEEAVRQASFSPDGRRIVTASEDNTARIWDAETGHSQGEILRHEGPVHHASFSPDGRRIVTASKDNTARIWDADTGQPHGEPLRHDEFVYRASFSPDGRRIVTASEDKTARIWDAETGQPCGEPLRHDGIVFHASFSPDSCRIITASGDKTARIWSVEIADSSVGSHLPSSSAIAWAHQALGLRYRDDGTLELIPGDERLATLQRLPESNDRWRDLSEWMNADPLTRPIVVGASLSTAQIAIRERDFALRPFRERKGWSHYDHDWSSQLALESALQYDTTVPLARLLLANVLERLERAEEEAKRDAGIFLHAAHLREYDLDRLPDDPSLRKRAAAILRELPDSQVGVGPKPTLAKDEADKLDPPVTP